MKTRPQAALRNRVRVALKAPVTEVWALVGDFPRLPEYSSGLERVDASKDARGAFTEYVCHFKPASEGGASIAHREFVRWYEPCRGYASSGETGNVFGLTNDLNLVGLEAASEGTVLTWEEYYDADDLNESKASYDQALVDIAQNLIHRFGGAILERFVEPKR